MGHRHPERESIGPLDRHTHDAGDRVAAALATSADGVRTTWISLGALAATAVVQLVVALMSGSIALLADTIHNFTDALTAVPLLIAFRLGRRPPSRRFTYGYHRAEDLAGVAIVLMILGSAVAAGIEAVRHLANPRPIDHVGLVLVAGVVGFAGNEAVATYRIRVGRRIGSAALVADGLHARTDGITSLGVVVSATAALAGFDRADAVVGILITVVIVWTLWHAARQVLHRILDGIDEPTIALIEQVAAAVAGVEHVTEARARWVGHRLLADLSVDVNGAMSVEAGHDVAERVRVALLDGVPRLGDAAVHVDPHRHEAH
jgi:cation diffusion facilitator family transporter